MHSKITALVLCLLASGAVAEDTQKLFDSLRAKLLAEIKASPNRAQDDPQVRSLQYLLVSLSRDWSENQSPLAVLDVLSQAQKDAPSEKLRVLCAKFTEAIQNEAKRESEEFEKRFHATVRSALEKGLAATSVKELDGPLADLSALTEDAGRFDSADRASEGKRQRASFSNVLHAATFILSTYQDGLFAKPDSATIQKHLAPSQKLESWIASHRDGDIPADVMSPEVLKEKIQAAVARISSEETRILSDKEYQPKLLELVGRVTKLEDLDAAFAQIDALKGNRGDNTEVSMLRRYYQIYRGIQAGTDTALRVNDTTSSVDSNPTLVTIKRQLTRYGLARLLKSSTALPQKEDESSEDFLRRVISTAAAAGDWQTIPRAVQLSENLRLHGAVEPRDFAGLYLLLGGVNLERAGIPAEAASTYVAALQTGSALLPGNYIRERLKAIHQKFPDAFDGVIPEGATAPKEQH